MTGTESGVDWIQSLVSGTLGVDSTVGFEDGSIHDFDDEGSDWEFDEFWVTTRLVDCRESDGVVLVLVLTCIWVDCWVDICVALGTHNEGC